MDEVQLIGSAIIGLSAVLVALNKIRGKIIAAYGTIKSMITARKQRRKALQIILQEFSYNGGASIKDAIQRIEKKQESFTTNQDELKKDITHIKNDVQDLKIEKQDHTKRLYRSDKKIDSVSSKAEQAAQQAAAAEQAANEAAAATKNDS